MSDHFVRAKFQAYYAETELTFICKAAADAPCHMVCPNECEQCDHARTQQVDYCNPALFITEGGEGVISQAEKQGELLLPVDISWNGDTYVWTARPITALPSMTDLADMLRETFTAEPGGVTWEQAAESLLILLAGEQE
jgi:hypothetical protein